MKINNEEFDAVSAEELSRPDENEMLDIMKKYTERRESFCKVDE